MDKEKFSNYIDSLSKEQLINKVHTYKSLYETTNIVKKNYEDLCENLDNEIKYYVKKSSDLEKKYEEIQTELKVYKILEKDRIKDDESKSIIQSIITISSAVIVYIFALYAYKPEISPNILFVILLLFGLYLISYVSIPFLASVLNIMFRYDTTDEKKEFIIFIAPFLISILIFILKQFLYK